METINFDRYRFTLGDFECLAIRDVHMGGGGPGYFPNIPAEVSLPILQEMYADPNDIPHVSSCIPEPAR